jgi:hypothetical protein
MTRNKGANPACKQGGLPKACGGGDENETLTKASIEQSQETRASNDLMGRGREKELGRKQRMRGWAWNRLWRGAVGFRVLVFHTRSSFLIIDVLRVVCLLATSRSTPWNMVCHCPSHCGMALLIGCIPAHSL